jgi:hypothetical protein
MTCVVALSACGDNTKGQDIANCEAKAMELFKPQSVMMDERSTKYVQVCMLAAGYQMERMCSDEGLRSGQSSGAVLASCWYPDNWWEKWKRR